MNVPTDAVWQDRIVIELNGGESLKENIAVYWDGHAGWAADPWVRYLKTRLDAIDFLLGNLQEEINGSYAGGELGSRRSERHQILLDLRRYTDDKLNTALQRGSASSYQVTDLNAAAIRPSPYAGGVPDANSPLHRADPYGLRRIY